MTIKFKDMEAKNLRIGNLVDTGMGFAPIYCFVYNNVRLYLNPTRKKSRKFGFLISELKPIPLTEDWLIKFGFEKKVEKYMFIYAMHYENAVCWIYLIGGGFEFELITGDERFNFGITYKYVHELQNLFFAITGIKLELKNE